MRFIAANIASQIPPSHVPQLEALKPSSRLVKVKLSL
jgi:hypothetical protein